MLKLRTSLGVLVLICTSSLLMAQLPSKGESPSVAVIEDTDPTPPPRHFFTIASASDYSAQQLSYLSAYLDWPWVEAHYPIDLLDARLDERSTINFATPDGQQLSLLLDQITRRSDKDYSWAGHLAGTFGFANFVVSGHNITGQVQYGNIQLQIKPLGEGAHVLLVVKPDSYPDDEDPNKKLDYSPDEATGTPGGIPGQQRTSASASVVDECPIRIIVVYTDDVAATHADPRAEIQLATDFYNNSNTNSAVTHSIELARIVEVPYAESGNSSTDLTRFRLTSDGFLDEVHLLRDLYDADMCMLVPVDGGGFCGRAYVNASASFAFGTTAYGCMAGNLSFTHEFGHMYGALHDQFVSPGPNDNHGITRLSINRRSVMAYNDACDCSNEAVPCPPRSSRVTPGSPSCTRIQYWSNAGVTVLGQSFGDVGTGENFNELNSSEATVRGFRTTASAKTQNVTDVVADDEEANPRALNDLSTDATTQLTYNSGAKGKLVAGHSITLRTGFHAKAGANVEAKLETCLPTVSRPAPLATVFPHAGADVVDQGFTLYPNPATAGADVVLDFQLAVADFVGIEVYRMDGAHVETVLYTPEMSQGSHRLSFSTRTLSAGSYFVSYSTSSTSVTKPLTVVD